jgi:hypothetical protein
MINMDEKEAQREAMKERILSTLMENSEAFVLMVQTDGQWLGELEIGGNVEACHAMAEKTAHEFHRQYLMNEAMYVPVENPEEDNEGDEED